MIQLTLFIHEYTMWRTLLRIHEVEKPLAVEPLWSSYDRSQMSVFCHCAQGKTRIEV